MSTENERFGVETRQTNNIASLPNDDYGPQFLAAIWILSGAATIFLALRLYCKLSTHKGLWWDDHVITASWVSGPMFPFASPLSLCARHLANPEKAAQVRDKPTMLGWFVGQVMKETGGKADPRVVNERVRSKLHGT